MSRLDVVARLVAASLVLSCAGPADPTDTGTTQPGLDVDVAPIADGEWVRPGLRTSWHWQLNGLVNTAVEADLYTLDLDVAATSIAILGAEGRMVFCHASAGSLETARRDATSFPPTVLGNPVSGVGGEVWLDVRDPQVHGLMLDRLDRAVTQGCDGVALTRLDSHLEDGGFSVSRDEALAYARFLYNAAHERGLAVAFRDSVDLAADLVDYADVAMVQRCYELGTCDEFAVFGEADKPLFNVEYAASFVDEPADHCVQAIADGVRSLVLAEALDNSVRVSCDTDFPSTTALSDVLTSARYEAADGLILQEMSGVDLAIVNLSLSSDQISALRTTTRVAGRVPVGEIELSTVYMVDGVPTTGQELVDAHGDWFLGPVPGADAQYADVGSADWQAFVLDQADQWLRAGLDGLFLAGVGVVDAFPATASAMVELIEQLDEAYPNDFLVQRGGFSVLADLGLAVDGVMFEGFSTVENGGSYVAVDATAPGYRDDLEAALAYRLAGGVVLVQDFAEPEQGFGDLICDGRERALIHRFLPSYSTVDFQGGWYRYPESCAWPEEPRLALGFAPSILHVRPGGSDETFLSHAGEGGFEMAINLSVGPFPPRLLAGFDQSRISPEMGALLMGSAGSTATAGTFAIPVQGAIASETRIYELQTVVHDTTLWVTQPGLSTVAAFDEPTLNSGLLPSRRTGSLQAPVAVEVDETGFQWVAEYVGDAAAPQPAGRILGYVPYELEVPTTVIDVGLNYPTDIALNDAGRVYVANSGLDETGAVRGLASIATIEPGEPEADITFRFDFETYGHPVKLALATNDQLFVSSSLGLVLVFALPTGAEADPAVVISVEALDEVRDLAFDAAGDLWLSGALAGASRVVEVPAGLWNVDPLIGADDLTAVIETGLTDVWGIHLDNADRLWAVNGTDGAGGPGNVVRFDGLANGAVPDQALPLHGAGARGVYVGRP